MFGFLMGTLNQFKKDELQSDNKVLFLTLFLNLDYRVKYELYNF